MGRSILIILALVIVALWARNASVLAEKPVAGVTQLLSHRGVHQTFGRENLNNETCTAARIDKPQHAYLENTIPSMAAALRYGATVIELDLQLTPEGEFVVFHDWTLDCRTNGTGNTRKTSFARLGELDIGYGYTPDNGETYPFRGMGIGMMPSFTDVMETFSTTNFLVNFKSNISDEGLALANLIAANPQWASRIWAVYGGHNPTMAYLGENPGARGFSVVTMKKCLKKYVMTGWTGRVPMSCRDTVVTVPISHVGLIWGWPNAFTARMNAVGSEVILMGPYKNGRVGSSGIDDSNLWARVPKNFDGYIWTNKIEVIGPLLIN